MTTSKLHRLALLLPAVILLGAGTSAQAQRLRIRFDYGWKLKVEKVNVSQGSGIGEWEARPLSAAPDMSGNELGSDVDSLATSDFQTVRAGEDFFHGREGYSEYVLKSTHSFKLKPGETPVLHFESVDDNATVYLNGAKLIEHEGWNDPFDVSLRDWKTGAENTIVVIVQNTAGPGGIGVSYFSESNGTPPEPKEAKPGFSDKGWRTIHLPHDFVIEGKFSSQEDAGHGALPKPKAWYRKTFSVPASYKGKSVWIDFDGAFSDAHVWLNGHFLGEHRSGYTGFHFNIGPYLNFGKANVIAVHLDSSKTEGWWYEGGGIYRHVWLNVTSPIHVAPLGGVYVTTRLANLGGPAPSGKAMIQTSIVSDQAVHGAVVESEVVDSKGRVAGKSIGRFDLKKGDTVVHQSAVVNRVHLWSVASPNLYTLKTRILVGGKATDDTTVRFGFRTIKFDPQRGFLLNGKPLKLKGTCNHQDFAGVGIGMPDSVLRWRIIQLKKMGSNAYRCSHNEVASELLDACDELGMVVMDENRELGDGYSGKANPRTTTNDLSDFKQELLRDRDHPSVIMWSLGNEEWAVQTDPAGARIVNAMKAVARKIDPTRPVTAALNGGHGSYMSQNLDLEGFNYSPQDYVRYHESHPDHPMFASETASTVTTRGEYKDDPVKGYVRAYDQRGTNTAEDAWEPIAEEPYNAGGFVWTGFDYKGEPTPYGWPCVNSHFGILDLAGFPKDVYYYYQAWWGSKPMVHVFPSWNWPHKVGEPIDVWAFGNGDQVELFLNGVSLGRKTMPKYRHVEWSVPYKPGRLVAKSYVDGKVVAVDKVETTGAPAKLIISTDRKTLKNDAEDCTMLDVSVVDSHGRVVPYAANKVTFSVSGPAEIAGVGNGDPSCHEPDRGSRRSAFHGLCLVIVQSKTKSGKVVVTVSSPGLKGSKIELEIVGGSKNK